MKWKDGITIYKGFVSYNLCFLQILRQISFVKALEKSVRMSIKN
ncbi:hypothetical protein SRRS_35650 [Sporomusa rhizae]